VTYDELEKSGWVRMEGSKHGLYPVLKMGRVSVDTQTHTLYAKGTEDIVRRKMKVFKNEGDAACGAVLLEAVLGDA